MNLAAFDKKLFKHWLNLWESPQKWEFLRILENNNNNNYNNNGSGDVIIIVIIY